MLSATTRELSEKTPPVLKFKALQVHKRATAIDFGIGAQETQESEATYDEPSKLCYFESFLWDFLSPSV